MHWEQPPPLIFRSRSRNSTEPPGLAPPEWDAVTLALYVPAVPVAPVALATSRPVSLPSRQTFRSLVVLDPARFDPGTCRHADRAELITTGRRNHNFAGRASYHGLK
jgi:hypothetical protein